MDYTSIAAVILAVLVYALYAAFCTKQVFNEVFSRWERILLLLLIWTIPFVGAYIANRRINPKWRQSFHPIEREGSLMSGRADTFGGGSD